MSSYYGHFSPNLNEELFSAPRTEAAITQNMQPGGLQEYTRIITPLLIYTSADCQVCLCSGKAHTAHTNSNQNILCAQVTFKTDSMQIFMKLCLK